jgi:hypothetical protein
VWRIVGNAAVAAAVNWRSQTCSKCAIFCYPAGMNYGEGTITRKEVIAATGISDPLSFFKDMPAISSAKLVLAPHVYPGTLTGEATSTADSAVH